MHIPWLHLIEVAGQLLRVLALFVVLVLPATWIALRRLPGLSLVARLSLGAALGFSLTIVGLQYVGLWSLDFAPAVWLVQLPSAAWVEYRHCRRPAAIATPAVGGGAGHDAEPRWLALTAISLVAGTVLLLVNWSFSELPQGVDSTFHCVVAQRQLDAGRATTDLWPLEELELNYPIGSHLWIAAACRWTGLAVHQVFRLSFVLALVGCGLSVAAWSERLFGSPAHAAAGAFVFVFASFQPSLLATTWGGLPSVLALWQALAGLFAVFTVRGVAGVAIAAVLWGGMSLTHHHAMVALPVAVLLAAAWTFVKLPVERRAVGRVAIAIAASGVVAATYLVPLALRVTRVRETGVLAYTESFGWPWEHAWNFGVPLVVLAGIGLMTACLPAVRLPRNFLVAVGVVWLASFVVLDYGSRLVSRSLFGVTMTPFTPSRFMLNLQFVLAIFGGGGLVEVWRRLSGRLLRGLVLAAVVAWCVWRVRPHWEPVSADSMLPIGRWVASHLPADALITGPISPWTTYVFHRESVSLFIPISEPARDRHRLKSVLLGQPGVAPWPAWRQRLGKPIFGVSHANERSWGRLPMHVVGELGVFELTPRDATDDASSDQRDARAP